MKYLPIAIALLITGCSSQSFSDNVADQVIESISGKDYSRNSAQCPRIKRQCANGNYDEWLQENGQIGCTCN